MVWQAPLVHKPGKIAVCNKLFDSLYKVLFNINKCCLKIQDKLDKHGQGVLYPAYILLICGVLALMPFLLARGTPPRLTGKLSEYNDVRDPLGILCEKTQLHLFGLGYATIYTHILASNRTQTSGGLDQPKPTSEHKHPRSLAKTLLLLLLRYCPGIFI